MISNEFEPVLTKSGELWKIRQVMYDSSSATEIFSSSKQYDYSPHEHEILQHCQPQQIRPPEWDLPGFLSKRIRVGQEGRSIDLLTAA
jgi:hypothetical protein